MPSEPVEWIRPPTSLEYTKAAKIIISDTI